MKPRRRGQAAMEYLMTYSWAILVVMLVGIAMWQLGIFNLGSSTSTTYTGFPRLKPQLTLVAVRTEGNMTSVFTNGGGGPIVITNVYGDCIFSTPDTSVSAGQNFRVIGTGCDVSGIIGDPFNLEIYIEYNITSAGDVATHREYGMLRGPLE